MMHAMEKEVDQVLQARRIIELREYHTRRIAQIKPISEMVGINPVERPDAEEPHANWYRRDKDTAIRTEYFVIEEMPGHLERNKHHKQNFEQQLVQAAVNLSRWDNDLKMVDCTTALYMNVMKIEIRI